MQKSEVSDCVVLFLSLGVSAEVSVATAASEQYMVHMWLLSAGGSLQGTKGSDSFGIFK